MWLPGASRRGTQRCHCCPLTKCAGAAEEPWQAIKNGRKLFPPARSLEKNAMNDIVTEKKNSYSRDLMTAAYPRTKERNSVIGARVVLMRRG
jgi:hypothetical protein